MSHVGENVMDVTSQHIRKHFHILISFDYNYIYKRRRVTVDSRRGVFFLTPSYRPRWSTVFLFPHLRHHLSLSVGERNFVHMYYSSISLDETRVGSWTAGVMNALPGSARVVGFGAGCRRRVNSLRGVKQRGGRLGAYRVSEQDVIQQQQQNGYIVHDVQEQQQHGFMSVMRMLLAQGWERHRKSMGGVVPSLDSAELDVVYHVAPVVPKKNILPFLRPVGVLQLNHLRFLSFLTEMTYNMEFKVRKDSVERLGLTLVTSSTTCARCLEEDRVKRQERMDMFLGGDGMCGVRDCDVEREGDPSGGVQSVGVSSSNTVSGMNDTVAATSLGTMDSAITDAMSMEQGTFSRGGSLQHVMEYSETDSDMLGMVAGMMKQQQNNISYFSTGNRKGSPANSRSSSAKNDVHDAGVGKENSLLHSCPTHWYVADDAKHHVRYFIIQGSDNMDHWRLNLSFDPVPFESPELGMKVHRGVYEAACKLYDVFLPLVKDYIQTYPHATITLTGHSLGGSLASMLMLMFLHRGVLDASHLAPVHTFGSPAVFCGGEGCSGSCSVNASHQGVLERLGLPHDAIRNVIMHRDIVPKAFACDYSSLAGILKRLHVSFREHHCLDGKRSVIFNTIGQTLILQPDERESFVGSDGYHPLLPEGPQMMAIKHSSSREQLNLIDSDAVSSSEEAHFELMNSPHPLTILSSRAAYGDSGTISRYHNPTNYTKALRGVLKSRGDNAQTILHRVESSDLVYQPHIDKCRRGDLGNSFQ